MDVKNCHENEDVLPGELLEDCWFFGNLLQTKSKSRMLRSFSDPCSSSNFPGNSYEETYESIKKPTTTKERRPSRKASSNSKKKDLVRAPSLPTSLESEDLNDEEIEIEIEFSMGKLIRQASLNYSDTRPPRKTASQSFTPSSRRKPENLLRTHKSLKDLEIEEMQGVKELGLDLDGRRDDLSSNSNAVQEKKRGEEYECGRPCVSAAWVAHNSAPPVPRWGGKRSTEDMKAQIKFWARAVASNVRQEC